MIIFSLVSSASSAIASSLYSSYSSNNAFSYVQYWHASSRRFWTVSSTRSKHSWLDSEASNFVSATWKHTFIRSSSESARLILFWDFSSKRNQKTSDSCHNYRVRGTAYIYTLTRNSRRYCSTGSKSAGGKKPRAFKILFKAGRSKVL